MILAAALLICSLDLRLNSGAVRKADEVHTIVLHHTAVATMGNSLRILRLRGMSYHYLIDDNGTVVQAVPFARTAYHAAGANHASIGISFIGGLDTGWEPTSKQRDAARALIATLSRKHPNIRYVVGHGDVRDINAGEPYGIHFDKLLSDLKDEDNVELRHPANEDYPLAGYREEALARLANPRTPSTPDRRSRKRMPPYESVTCGTGKRATRVKYPVSLGR
jgi:hypothetical protein